jgi:hypothetical protein
MRGQLTIDGREVELELAPRAAAAPAEPAPALFSSAPFAQFAGQLAGLSDAPPCSAGPDPCPVPAERESEPESAREPAPRSTSPADPEHRARMDAGRKRAQLERELRGVERVERYRAWTRAGCPGPCPEVPTDAEWADALEHGSAAARGRWAS